MRNKIVAKRYADGFLSFAEGTGLGRDKAVDELKELKLLLYKNPEFYEFLESMEIVYKEKCSVIEAVLKDFSQESRQFLKLLLEKKRIKEIFEICDYARINYSSGEAVDALLKTSYPLDLGLIRKIKKHLEDKLKKNLKLHIELDASLLGGVRVAVGNIIIDGSIRKRLDDLREKLMTVRVP